MKNANGMMLVLLAGLLAVAGCGKEEPRTPVMGGVKVDLPKLQEAFTTAAPELQTAVSEVAMGVRYGDPRAFAALDKIVKAPSLTDAQKKIVAEVTEQIKELASKAPTAPPR